MTPLAQLVEFLGIRGFSAEDIAQVIDLAQQHSAEFHRNSTGIPPDLTAERRRAYDRERKRNSAEKEKPASSLSTLEASSTLVTKKEEGASGNREPRSRGTPLPDDFTPNIGHYAVAAELRGRREFADECCTEMREWAKANGNRAITRKADWDMTLLGWIRRSARAGPRGLPNGQPHRPGSKEDNRERSAIAYRKLSEYVDSRADDAGAGSGHREANVGLLSYAKPARS